MIERGYYEEAEIYILTENPLEYSALMEEYASLGWSNRRDTSGWAMYEHSTAVRLGIGGEIEHAAHISGNYGYRLVNLYQGLEIIREYKRSNPGAVRMVNQTIGCRDMLGGVISDVETSAGTICDITSSSYKKESDNLEPKKYKTKIVKYF